MRSISAELLAAALSKRGRPSVSLDIHDKRLRWTLLHYDDGSTKWIDQVADGAAIHRVRSNGTDIEWCKVSTVGTKAEWTAWSLVKATDVTDGEVAIARITTDDIRIYALQVDVADTTWDIVYIDSTDGGANWDAAWSVAVAGIDGAKAGDAPEHPRLAALVARLFYTDAGSVKALYIAWGGAPGTSYTWGDLGVLTVRGGLAAARGSATEYRVVAAGAGNISIGTYNPATHVWGTARQIAPGGAATPSDTAALSNPAVLYANGLYLIAWLDNFATGGTTWTQPVIVSSTDWIHFGNEVALSIWATTYRRVALAYLAATKTVYAANEKVICQAAFWESDDALQNLEGIVPDSYTRETNEQGSRVRVQVLNKDRLYDTVDQAGEYGQCIRPLAVLELKRGYITTDPGPPATHQAEVEVLDPHYIIGAEITQGFNRGHLQIEAVDGWGLLRLWRANESLTWTGETIEWLLTEICARVGLAFTASVAASFDYALPVFTVNPTQTGAEVVGRLLLLAGAIAYFDETGTMKAHELYGYSPSYFDVGTEGEILQGSYATATVKATSFRVFGDAAGAAGEITWQSMSLGLRMNKSRQEYRLATDAACLVLQRYEWTRGRIGTRQEWVLVPMRPDPEMWDRVRAFPDGDVIPVADSMRRVVGIREWWNGKKGEYTTRVEMQDV